MNRLGGGVYSSAACLPNFFGKFSRFPANFLHSFPPFAGILQSVIRIPEIFNFVKSCQTSEQLFTCKDRRRYSRSIQPRTSPAKFGLPACLALSHTPGRINSLDNASLSRAKLKSEFSTSWCTDSVPKSVHTNGLRIRNRTSPNVLVRKRGSQQTSQQSHTLLAEDTQNTTQEMQTNMQTCKLN